VQSVIDFTVIILNWNAAADTCNCLKQVMSWRSLKPKILVVDNGSTDNSAEIISAQFPAVQLILNGTNIGFSGGNNTAIKKIMDTQTNGIDYCLPPFLLLLNNDAFIEEKYLNILLQSIATDPGIGVLGPLIYKDDSYKELLSAGGLDPARHGKTYWVGTIAEEYAHRTAEPYEVDYVSGTVALLRTKVIRGIGLFDDDYFFSCEMADLCERVKKQGYSCMINPAAKSSHNMCSTGKNRDTLYLYYSLRNRFLYIRKFRQEQLFRLFLFWTLVAGKGMLKAFLTMKFSRARALFLALRDGLLGQYGGKNELFLDHH